MKKVILLLSLVLLIGSFASKYAYADTITYQNGTGGYMGGFDNELSNNNSNTVFSDKGSTYGDRVGTRFCSAPCNNILLRFTNLGIDPSRVVTNIKLLVKVGGKQGGSDFLYAYKVGKNNWDSTEATWNSYRAGLPWSTPGGDKGAQLAKVVAANNYQWTTFDLGTNISLQELEQNGVLISTDVPGWNFIWFYSNESANVNDRPKLVVTYAVSDAVNKISLPTITLSANPMTVTSGGVSTISWSSTNATACVLSNGSIELNGSFVTPPLTTSTTYTATCVGSGGTGTGSVTVTVNDNQTQSNDTTAPDRPDGLTATAVSSSQINLTWDATTDNIGVAGYTIFRGKTQVGTTAGLTLTDTGLSASTKYMYYVQAFDSAGNMSRKSRTSFATTDPIGTNPFPEVPDTTSPTTPTNLIATPISSSQINLSWTASTDNKAVTGYRVYRDGGLLATINNVTTYQNTGLTAGTSYTYTVQAFDAAGNSSAQSVSVKAQTSGGIITVAPTVTFSANPMTVTTGGVSTISWSSTNATACVLSNGTSGINGSFVTPALVIATTYAATCTGPGGTGVGRITVSVTSSSTVPVTSNGLKIDLSYVDKSSPEFTRFKSFVDKALAGNPDYGFSARHAAYMYKITNEAKYCAFAIEQVDSCSNSYEKTGTHCGVEGEEYSISTGVKPKVSFDSYLYVGGIIGSLAITYDWCGSMMTQSQKTRWENYANQTIYNVWHPTLATWGGTSFPWSGWATNNPGNNYYYSFVEATMYWGLAYKDATLLSFVRNEKLQPLINYSAQLPGGGSLEGTGYGASHMRLFELYQTWKDSVGEDIANMTSHLTDSIHFWLHATTPNRSNYAPIGDLSRVSYPSIYDYHRILMLEARHLTKSTSSQDIDSWWLNNITLTKMSSGFNSQFDLLPKGTTSSMIPNEPLSYRATGVGRIFARTDWGTSALWMTFVAGKYNQSHAHQDQGSFNLANNNFLAVTNNIYSQSGIHQSTNYNNMLRFEQNGVIVPQKYNTESIMTVNQLDANGNVDVTGNITPAYGVNTAVNNWTRNVKFSGRKLTVTDNFSVGTGVQTIFQIHTPVAPVISGNLITAGELYIRVVTPQNPTINIVSLEGHYRIDISGRTNSYVVELSDKALLARANINALSGNITQKILATESMFTRDLARGSVGDDVRALQKFLNQNGFIVATVGEGSPGNETTFFGEGTKNALANFQIAKGIAPSLGYFGSITRAYILK